MCGFRIIIGVLFLTVPGGLFGQGLIDALQFSQQNFHGSARFNAMGGAFTALGGDLGAIHLNPAAGGVFTKNELGFTLGIGSNAVHSNYYGTQERAQNGGANVNNMGILFASEINHPDWKALNVGITYTRTNDYNHRINYSGTQNNHSFAQHLVGIANSGNVNPEGLGDYDPFLAFPAYQSYVIDVDPDDELKYRSFIEQGENVSQEVEWEESGRTSEFMISLGSNYKDRLYIGMGIKVGTLTISRTFDFFEAPEENDYISDYRFGSDLEIRGSSISISGGLIALLTKNIRFGASVQSPNFYVNNEYFSTNFAANLLGDYAEAAIDEVGTSRPTYSSPEGNNRYNFNTPWRFTGGVATIIGKRAIISAEYEFMDYGTSQFGSNRRGHNYDYGIENEDIRAVLGGTSNIRAGFEYRLLPVSLRAGYAYFQDPVKPTYQGDLNRDRHQFSVGAGMRWEKIYLDAGYFYRMTNSQHALYNSGNNEAASLAIDQHGFSVTIGVRY